MDEMLVATAVVFVLVSIIHAAQCLILKQRPAWLTWTIWVIGVPSLVFAFAVDATLLPNLVFVIFHLFSLPWFAMQLLWISHLRAGGD